jgi:hypothetical protein
VVELLRVVKNSKSRVRLFNSRSAAWLAPAVAVLMLMLISWRAVEYRLFEYVLPLRLQDESFATISAQLSDSDKVYVHGTAELLVLLNRPNLNPYIFLDSGKDDFIAARKYGGSFMRLVDEIKASEPKIIALTRLQRVAHRDELKKLIDNYDRLDLKGGYEIYVRRQ